MIGRYLCQRDRNSRGGKFGTATREETPRKAERKMREGGTEAKKQVEMTTEQKGSVNRTEEKEKREAEDKKAC